MDGWQRMWHVEVGGGALEDEGVRRGIMEDGGPSVGAACGNRRLRIYCKWRIVTGRRQSKRAGVGLGSF